MAPLLVSALFLTACGGGGGEGGPAASGSPRATATSEAPPVNPGSDAPSGPEGTQNPEGPVLPRIVFDDRFDETHIKRGGGSSIIQVYRGPGTATPDRQPAGTYEDGQSAVVTCKAIGRTVFADTNVGERPGSSDVWYLLAGNEPRYATELYGTIQPPGAAVRDCPPPTTPAAAAYPAGPPPLYAHAA
jgi:hypothetical protein